MNEIQLPQIDVKQILRDARATVARQARDKLRAAGIFGVKPYIAKRGEEFALRLFGSPDDVKLAEIVIFSKERFPVQTIKHC